MPGDAGNAQRLAQEGGLLGVALDQMDRRARRFRQCAGQHHAGKTSAAAEVDPDLGRRERGVRSCSEIGDVPGPQIWKRRRRHQIGLRLPLQQQIDIAIQPRLCFT